MQHQTQSHPGVHVWLFNHPRFYGISDQIHFLYRYFKEVGIPISCGKSPSDSRCNIVIENFDDKTSAVVRDFCRSRSRCVSVVLTEHVDIAPMVSAELAGRSQILLHGKSVLGHHDYLPLTVLLGRTNNLLALSDVTFRYYRLGDLPQMNGFECLAFGRVVDTLWFPKLPTQAAVLREDPMCDFVFFGTMTSFRKDVLGRLESNGFTFVPAGSGVSTKQRNRLIRQAKYCLNIPQDEAWPWLSPMRVLSALDVGVPTLSLGTNDGSAISRCVIQLPDFNRSDFVEQLRYFLNDHRRRAVDAVESYALLRSQGTESKSDIVQGLRGWALIDGI